MDKLIQDKFYVKQLLAFVGLQPLIDIYRVFVENKIEFAGISLAEWINILAFGYLCVLFVIKNFRTPKYYVPLVVYGVAFVLYFALHAWNILQFNEDILNGAEISVFKELYFIIRVYLIPLVVFYMMLCVKIHTKSLEIVTKYLSWFISIVIVVTNLLKVSFVSYAGSIEGNAFITRNIIEWFTNPDAENIAYMTSKGWFYMGNQIGIILFMLYPFTVMYAMKYKKRQNYFLVLLQGIAMIMVGTKVAAFGCVLILLSALGIVVVFGFILKQIPIRVRDFVVLCSITLGLTVLLLNSPIISMQTQRGESSIVDVEDLQLRKEMNEFEADLEAGGEVARAEIIKFAKTIKKYSSAYGIDKEFVELFDVEDNYMFWYKIAVSANNDHIDYRFFKKMIYTEVLKKNDNQFDRLLGIGYTSNFPYSEQDFVGQSIWFGSLGTALLIGPYFLCALYTVIYILKNRQTNMRYENAFFAVSLGGITALSIMAGHLFFGIFSIVIFAFLIAAFYHMQKEW